MSSFRYGHPLLFLQGVWARSVAPTIVNSDLHCMFNTYKLLVNPLVVYHACPYTNLYSSCILYSVVSDNRNRSLIGK
jgi:hypothetical protein